ncbi:MAG: polysaccharide deacetylase family protein [Clostridia bacterium]|nr:polysaccharide deacetylase family protein [Clostridia bacterium]
MKKQKRSRTSTYAQIYNISSHLVLSVLVLSIGALCLAPIENSVKTEGEYTELYRCGRADSNGISLMFNVYWGTDEVYRILDVLKKYDAKATFFIGGCWADDNVDCLRDIYAAGHEIGNHGYFHKDHEKLNVEDNQKEIADCNRFIELAIGEKPTLFAPPSGAYGDNTLAVCKLLQMKTILWSRDTIDWRDKNAAVIYTRATKQIKGGDFVLMHPMKETADALEDVLQYYKQKSFSVITVSENLQNNEKS